MIRILIIDDNIDICETVCDILRSENYEAIFENSAKSGIKKAIETIPDLILCDMRMSTAEEGLYVLSEIRKNEWTNKIPFLFYTIVTDISVIVKGLEQGAQDYIIKEDPDEILLARIKAHLNTNDNRIRELEKKNYELYLAKENLENANNELKLEIQKIRQKTFSKEKLYTIFEKVFKQYNDLDSRKISKEEAINLLTANKYHELFSILETNLKNEDLEIVILSKCHYTSLGEDLKKNMISNVEYYQEMAKLRTNLLKVINSIGKESTNDTTSKTRKIQLQKQLKDYYKLLDGYENRLIVEDDPRTKLKYERELEQIKWKILEIENELKSL